MYRTPSFGNSKDRNNGSGSRDGSERSQNGGSSFSQSTSNLDRVHIGSPSIRTRERSQKTSVSASTLGLHRRDSSGSSNTSLERSGSYLREKYVPLSERGIALKSGTDNTATAADANNNSNGSNKSPYTSLTSVSHNIHKLHVKPRVEYVT